MRLLCWLGIHKWGELQFGHYDDQAQHNLKCCGRCGTLRAYIDKGAE